MSTKNPLQVRLENVRLLYAAALFTPQKGPNGEGEAKYSATFGFAPTHPAAAAVKAALKAAAEQKWGAKAGEIFVMLKAGDKICLHDGDAKADKDGYKGNLYVSASNKLKPLVVDNKPAPGQTSVRIIEANEGRVYSGCYVNATIELWAQDNKFGKRINASLMGVQFLRDGQRLSGGGVASVEDYAPIPEAADEKPAGAPQGGGATAPAAGANPDPFA